MPMVVPSSPLSSLAMNWRDDCQAQGVTCNVLHPGLVRTGFASNLGAVPSAVINFFMRFVGMTPEQGAQTSVYLATSPVGGKGDREILGKEQSGAIR